MLVQELRLLKEFEKNDITLASRLEKKHAEKSEIVAKVAECQERLALKKVEIEKLLEKDKLIMAEMSQALYLPHVSPRSPLYLPYSSSWPRCRRRSARATSTRRCC